MRKNYLLRCWECFSLLGMSFSSKLDLGSNISIAKTASKKTGALACSMKFLSPEVALHLYKSTIRPCMEYCCHVWTGASSCCLELSDKLQNCICRTVCSLSYSQGRSTRYFDTLHDFTVTIPRC